jgi:L-glyceraldehyde 3-phosphate reductase
LFKTFDLGITHFDLANNYGPPPGSAEKNFGKILKKDFKGYRDELIISTKAGYTMWEGPYGDWGSRKYLLASLDQSLKRLKLDYVDIFYSHRYDPATPLEETMSALATAVQSGKALYVGVSNYPPEQTKQAFEILKKWYVPFIIHQPKYSMLVRTPEEGLFDTLDELGLGCIVFSPLAQGILTDKYLKGIPADSRAAKPQGHLKEEQITPEIIEKVKKLKQIAEQRNQTMAQMALAWVLRRPTVTSALIGVSSVSQLLDCYKALENTHFDDEQLSAIELILA